jgi:RNA polymerase sigma factor (sigma-70 family)
MDQKDFYLYIDGKPVKVTEEVYHAYYHAEDKERYFMGKLKKGRTVVDPITKQEHFVPGREQSYEHLLEQDWQFPALGDSVEDTVIKSSLLEKLQVVLQELSDEEMELVEELFYLEKTEREAAKRFAVSQNTIHYRKNKILDKLKKLMEK